MPAKGRLLASAGSLGAIGEAIARFYGGSDKALVPDGDNGWRLARPGQDRPLLEGVRVVKVKSRYRFEALE